MALPHNPMYMDLPDEIKIQIHQKLDDNKTELLKSRLVCKGFFPQELGVAISLFGTKKVIIKFNMTAGVKTPTHEQLDRIQLFDTSTPICDHKPITKLSDLPVSLLQKTVILITLFNDAQDGLLQDLDLILEHCTSIKLCLFYLTKANGFGAFGFYNWMERLERIFTKNHENFTHLFLLPVGTSLEDEKSFTFNSGSLAKCNKLSTCLIIGHGSIVGYGSQGLNALLEVQNFDKLPKSLQTLGFYKVECHDLEWAAENLVNLSILYLEVDESRQQFSQDLFQRLCNLPALTLMELLFVINGNAAGNDRLREVKGILQGIEQLCQDKAGIQVQIKEEATPHGIETRVTIQATIIRPPFAGFGDKRLIVRDTDDLD